MEVLNLRAHPVNSLLEACQQEGFWKKRIYQNKQLEQQSSTNNFVAIVEIWKSDVRDVTETAHFEFEVKKAGCET